MRVAVIDDGVEGHEELTGRVLTGYTPQTSSSNPDTHGQPNANDSPGSPFGHGECCAGIIAASHNDIGIRGVAPNIQIVPVNIFNDWYIDYSGKVSFHEDANDLAAAIDWAWDVGNADVLSDSWGYKTTNSDIIPNADNIIAAIGRARTQGRNGLGAVVVFASGNENQYFSGVTFPANVDGVITVGAIDKNGNIWNYSSRGSEMNLVAPSGGNPGDIYTIDRMGSKGFKPGNYYYNFNGTSAACPQVSGVAALMLSANPFLTGDQVRAVLQQTAVDMGPSGFDNTFGYGRVDAYAAVEAINLHVTGPSPVCISGSVFTLNNRPTGTTVSWTNSNNLSYVSGQGTDNYTVKAFSSTTSGMGWVKAIVNSGCSNDTIKKDVWVGKPVTPTIIYPFNKVGTNSLIEVLAASPGAENYNWSVGGGTITSGQGTSDIWIMTSSTCLYDLTIRLTTSNACGSSAQAMKSIPFDCSGGITPLSVSPNPASQTITVELTDTTSTTTNHAVNEAFTVQLFDAYNKPVYQRRETLRRFTINVSGYRPGVYYLRVIKGNKVYSKKVIITK